MTQIVSLFVSLSDTRQNKTFTEFLLPATYTFVCVI